MTIWRQKKGTDRRVRQGYPWVFESELAHSAKEIEARELIELRDHQDHFLAFGYGHPTSQILFRKLSGNAKERDVGSVEFCQRRLQRARELRHLSGWAEFSHRWLYGEADGIPGLVIDAFKREVGGWVVAVQASTAGAESLLPSVFEAIEDFAPEMGGALTIVEAPSSRSRVMEGLAVREKNVIFGPVIGRERLLMRDGLVLSADLIGGQKTGFFLDQQWNAGLLKQLVPSIQGPLKVVDLCCYVGQWGAHIAQAAEGRASVTLVDASEAALGLAVDNVKPYATSVDSVCTDVLHSLGAYVKLNREAIRLTKPGGLFLSSSCSGLVKTAEFSRALGEAAGKSGRVFQQVLNGGHGPDHPVRPEFPEGEYLKAVMGRIGYPF